MALDRTQVAFQVKTEQLRETSSVIRQKRDAIQQNLETMQETAQMTAGYWEGEGGETCRAAFREYRESMDELLARLAENVADLEKIAGIYEENETTVQKKTEALPEDILV